MVDKEYNLYSLRKRISAIVCAISFLFFVLVIRLFYIQIYSGQKLQKLAYSQWTRDLPITAERGKIYDLNGSTLAVSFTTYDIYIRGREINDSALVSSMLSRVLNINYDTVYQKVSLRNVSEVLIKLQVDSNTSKKIAGYNYDGVFLAESIKRYYPYGDLLSQVIGFTTVDNVGQAGIEAYFNNVLQGKNGSYLVQSDLQGKEIKNSLRTYVDPTKGSSIYLTIDANIEMIVEQTLNKIMLEQKCKSASCIIMDAESGEIVSCSSKPSFDLNNVPRDNATSLMEMTKNKIAVDVYEPGSTFKILTITSALESGVTSLNDSFYCSGYRIVDGQKIKCWKTKGHGSQNLTTGLVNSCNCVFMTLAERMRTDKFYNYLNLYGLGSKTGVEISSESSGILMKKSIVKNVDLARIGFGQAVAVSPLQLITAICAAVNGGELLTPTIIKKAVDENSKTTYYHTKQVKNKVISSKTSQTLNEMLKKVVNKTDDYSFVSGYDVGGKTGTAQKYENGSIARGKYISSFVGTYPASNPKYVMLLLVDEPGAGAYYGSVVAAPYGKEIFSNMFNYLGEKPIKIVEDKVEIMPNIVGKSLLEASIILNNMSINYEVDGDGSKVVKQLPPCGTKISLNDTIIIITD